MLKGDKIMEKIKFTYKFEEKEFPTKNVKVVCDGDEAGLNTSDVCEAFVDFMESAGFSIDNIYDYFNAE